MIIGKLTNVIMVRSLKKHQVSRTCTKNVRIIRNIHGILYNESEAKRPLETAELGDRQVTHSDRE